MQQNAQQIINFLKALDSANLNMQKHLQNFYNLDVYSRKMENVQILFKGVCANLCKISSQK